MNTLELIELVPVDEHDPRIQEALAELRELIARRYPDASFTIARGEDPEGIYLKPMVDVEDLDEVADVFMDRLIDLQVEDGLPVYVFPVQPLERVGAQLRQKNSRPLAERLPILAP